MIFQFQVNFSQNAIYKSCSYYLCISGTVNYYGLVASEAHYIEPGKRPMSSMSPSIILDDNGNVKLTIGAAGGSHIITSVAKVFYFIDHKYNKFSYLL